MSTVPTLFRATVRLDQDELEQRAIRVLMSEVVANVFDTLPASRIYASDFSTYNTIN